MDEMSSQDPNYTTIKADDIAAKFIEIYWQQTQPLPLPSYPDTDFVLNQHSSQALQATVITLIDDLSPRPKTLNALQKNQPQWQTLKKQIVDRVLRNPIERLQSVNGEDFEILYRIKDYKKGELTLFPTAIYALKQFSTIIEELCQKIWIDTLRLYKKNQPILQGLPNLDRFLFQSARAPLNKTIPLLRDIQENRCFYCGKTLNNAPEVDHFIPWSLYQYDTGHNFVLSDKHCNGAKSNLLANLDFLKKWQDRNQIFDAEITQSMSFIGFLTDRERSENIALWAYKQAAINHYPLWTPKPR